MFIGNDFITLWLIYMFKLHNIFHKEIKDKKDHETRRIFELIFLAWQFRMCCWVKTIAIEFLFIIIFFILVFLSIFSKSWFDVIFNIFYGVLSMQGMPSIDSLVILFSFVFCSFLSWRSSSVVRFIKKF